MRQNTALRCGELNKYLLSSYFIYTATVHLHLSDDAVLIFYSVATDEQQEVFGHQLAAESAHDRCRCLDL